MKEISRVEYDDSGDEKLEEFDMKHYRAMTQKVENYLQVVAKMAEINSAKELKAKNLQDTKSEEKRVLSKMAKMVQKQKKAKEIAEDILLHEQYERQQIKNKRYQKVMNRKKEIRREVIRS